MRARLALEAGGIEVALREIVLRDKAPEMIAVSEKATVPVMVLDDGLVLEESLDIMRWALGASDAGEKLAPDRGSMRGALALIERMDVDFKPHLDAYKYYTVVIRKLHLQPVKRHWHSCVNWTACWRGRII